MVGGTYFVATGGIWSWEVVIIGLIYALGPTSVLFGKHIDKSIEDRKKKVFTLPVIIGERISRWGTIAMWILQYILIALLIINGHLSIAVAVVLLAIPKFIGAVKIFAKPRPTEKPEDKKAGRWPLYLVAHAFDYNQRFGLLFLLGLIINLFLIKFGIF